MMDYITRTRKMLHFKELRPKVPRYLIMQHFSRPRYIIHDNTHKRDNYFLNITHFIIKLHNSYKYR